METLWLALLAMLFAGYFVLGGYDYGVGMLLPVLGREERERRRLLNALGPFFLGNEVWLIAAAGVLFGAFPHLESRLVSGLYPFVVTLLLGLVIGNAAVQLRSRQDSPRGRRIWDGLVVAGSLLPALALGASIGAWVRGIPVDAAGNLGFGLWYLVNPVVVVWAAALAALFAAHGATFLALRLPAGDASDRSRRRRLAGPWWQPPSADGSRASLAHGDRAAELARRLTAAAGGAVVLAVAVSVASPQVRAVANPWLALPVAAGVVMVLAVARDRLGAGRPGWAFACTSVAAASPLALGAVALYPYLLASSAGTSANLTVSEAAADGTTLTMLGWFAIPLVPIIAMYQFWSWWAFRGRLDERSPTYF